MMIYEIWVESPEESDLGDTVFWGVGNVEGFNTERIGFRHT